MAAWNWCSWWRPAWPRLQLTPVSPPLLCCLPATGWQYGTGAASGGQPGHAQYPAPHSDLPHAVFGGHRVTRGPGLPGAGRDASHRHAADLIERVGLCPSFPP
eukprot:1158203-Pelagomonas_calceolata.AAC.4